MALRRYGYCLGSLGEFEQSFVPLRRSIEIDPMSLGNRIMLGRVLHLAGRLEEAETEFLSIRSTVEDHPSANRYLALIALQRHAYPEAFQYFGQALKRGGSSGIVAELAYAHAVAGQPSEALRLVKDLKEHEKYPGSADYSFALVYVGLGEVDAALEWFEKACKARDYRLVLANVDPIWSSLRSDPRFGRLTAQLGITPVSLSKRSTS
jgi:tetratricopeptide (TPR) repeat protein